MNHKNAAVVCFSGGQDSTVCLYWVKKHFEQVEAVIFRYGQRHVNEVDVAVKIASEAETPFHILDLSLLSQLSSNSLTDSTIRMDEEKPSDSYPNTFVPGRNLLQRHPCQRLRTMSRLQAPQRRSGKISPNINKISRVFVYKAENREKWKMI